MESLWKSYHSFEEVIGNYYMDACEDIGFGRAVLGVQGAVSIVPCTPHCLPEFTNRGGDKYFPCGLGSNKLKADILNFYPVI